jgi:hypothetical protein
LRSGRDGKREKRKAVVWQAHGLTKWVETACWLAMTPRQEAQKILELCAQDAARALELLERQLNTLHTRAQVLLSLAGVVITVTGFSGRIIAHTSPLAQLLVVAGLAVVVFSAIWVYTGVMGLRWITSEFDGEPCEALGRVVARRDRKTRRYQLGGLILSGGLLLYGTAVALMLFHP